MICCCGRWVELLNFQTLVCGYQDKSGETQLIHAWPWSSHNASKNICHLVNYQKFSSKGYQMTIDSVNIWLWNTVLFYLTSDSITTRAQSPQDKSDASLAFKKKLNKIKSPLNAYSTINCRKFEELIHVLTGGNHKTIASVETYF